MSTTQKGTFSTRNLYLFKTLGIFFFFFNAWNKLLNKKKNHMFIKICSHLIKLSRISELSRQESLVFAKLNKFKLFVHGKKTGGNT